MTKAYIFLITALLSVSSLSAQSDNITLLAQSVDGKTVKLFWFINSWDRSITGFDIKRKEGMQNWVKLNSAPILPGIFTKRKLAASGANLYDESILKPKLYKLLRTHELQETDPTRYLQKLNSDPAELPQMSKKMARDYDIAVFNGFGYIDHTLVQKSEYQYGLFIQGTDKLLAKTTWDYGAIPDLDLVQELTSKASTDSKGIKVIWVADTAKIRKAHVAGFNIYREGIRLNTERITPEDGNDPSVFTWNDKYANSTTPTQYSIAAESIFDIEGIIRSYAYDPAEHTRDYKRADVTEIASLGYYFKEGTGVKWTFPKESEKYIKGFYIEKANMPSGYKTVSALIDPAARSYTDKTPSQVNGYIKMRVRTVYKDRKDTAGGERLFCYFPVNEPPRPQNLKVKSVQGDKIITANMTWEPPIAGDSITDYYKVYAFDATSNKFIQINDYKITANSFSYVLQHASAGVHQFCVTSVSRSNAESMFSDTASLETISLELPAPVIKKVVPDNNNKTAIEWQYPDIADLKGFRLTQNGKTVAGENELRKDTRQFLTGKLDEGASYEFIIMAISNTGVQSPNSAPFHVVVTETSK